MSKKKKPAADKLRRWQDRLAESNSAFSAETDRMDERERLYNQVFGH